MNEETKETPVVEEQPKEEVKTFTQEEVNKIVQDRVFKEKKKQLPKEELDAYNQWKDNQKTETERINDKINSYEEKIKQANEQYSALRFENTALKKNIKPDSLKDVQLLSAAYTSEEVDMDAAIDKVLEKYPHFKKETVAVTTTNSTVTPAPGADPKKKVSIADMTSEEYYKSQGIKPFNSRHK